MMALLRKMSLRPKRKHNRRLTPDQVTGIRRVANGDTQAALADEFGACRETVRRALAIKQPPQGQLTDALGGQRSDAQDGQVGIVAESGERCCLPCSLCDNILLS
jgi:hypothetical protein